MPARRDPDYLFPFRSVLPKILRKFWPVFFISLVLLSSGGLVLAQTAGPPTISISGTFFTIWGDPVPGSNNPGATTYYLTDGNNPPTRLVIDPKILQAAGGNSALNQKRVKLTGTTATTGQGIAGNNTPVVTVQTIEQETAAPLPNPTPAAAVTGSKPYINVLCKFPDKSNSLTPASYFNGLLGESYPGLSQYWREVSYNNINLLGSTTTAGWYTLPHPQSFYISSPGSFQNAYLDQLARDCSAAAENEVYFPNYYGINFIFNDLLDCCSWGGAWPLTLDGVSKTWPVTWMPPWGWQTAAVLAHEQGHSLGLNHSPGINGNEYSNPWDVMSDIYTNCKLLTDPTYGCLGQGTISYHKDFLGWIPPSRKYIYSGIPQTITLERLNQPTGSNYLMAQIPIGNSTTQFYTVEARRKIGYDVKLPGDAVVIHKVDTSSSLPASLVGTGTGAWTPGQTFTDTSNNVVVSVVSATATGFVVVIGSPPVAPSNLTTTTVAANQIDLHWTDNSNTESGFRIERKTGVNGTWSEIAVAGQNATSYSDTNGIALDTIYYYQVRAYDALGNSGYSNSTLAYSLPNAPSGLNASALSSTQAQLGWQNNSTTAQGNRIERATNLAGPWSEIAVVGPNVANYLDLGRIPDTTYYYQVRAYNLGGNSAYSNQVTITMPPAEPSNLTATAVSSTQIDLSWQNNSASATGFIIERRTGPRGSWNVISTTLTTIPASYSDSNGVAPGTLYFYRVRSYRAGVGISAFSNLASAITFSTLQVTKNHDDGTANTLSWAIIQANAGPVKTITFNLSGGNTIVYDPGSIIVLPAVQSGVTIGGSCGVNGPGIIIDGTNAPTNANGLILNGGTTLYGITIQKFHQSQLKVLKPNNVEVCVKAFR